MSKLLLINGFPEEVKVHQLVEFIKANFKEEDVCRVWMDPYKEPRAVAMFQTEIETAKIHYLNGKLNWADHCIVISATNPTWSVFVRTFHSFSFGALDKLKSLFTKSDDGSRRGVVKTEKLDDDCFSLSFQEGWDTVLEVCDKRWTHGGKFLSVCPYFDCFKDSFQNQYDNLYKESKKNKLDPEFSKYGIVQVPGSLNITSPYIEEKQISPTTRCTSASFLPSSEKEINCFKSKQSVRTNCLIVFEHPFLPKLLFLLNFKEALKQQNCAIHESSTDMDFEIIGDKTLTKNISKLLHGVYRKLMDNLIRNDYLALDKVQSFLKKIIESQNASVILTSDGDQLSLDVCTITDGKVSFEQFVKQLVIIKKCSSLPIKESLENQDWIEFMHTFNATHSVLHIFQTKLMIDIASLSIYSSDIEVVADEINLKIENIFNLNKRDSFQNPISFQTVCTYDTGTIEQFSEIIESSELSYKKKTKDTHIYTFQRPSLAKILIALKLQKAIQDEYQVTIQEISDAHFSVSGQRNKVEDIFSTISQLEKMVNEDFLKFCDDKTVLLVRNSKHCVRFVHAQKEILVQVNVGQEKIFTEYLTLLLMARECSTFPSKNFENHKIWIKFCNDFHETYQQAQIIITEESKVFLFFLVNDEKTSNLLQNIVKNHMSTMAIDDIVHNYDTVFEEKIHGQRIDYVQEKERNNYQKNEQDETFLNTVLTKFHWMYETLKGSNSKTVYQYFEPRINNLLEITYLQGNLSCIDINVGPFGKADFYNMIITSNDQIRTIIRTEKYDILLEEVIFPNQWQTMNKTKWKLFPVESEKEFTALRQILENDLSIYNNKVDILKIERMQNEDLFKHCIWKSYLMKDRLEYKFLWHRIEPGTQELVCEYGCHRAFSGVPNGGILSKGTVFFKDPTSCIKTEDTVYDREVCLLYCQVLIGKSGPLKKDFKIPPVESNEHYDSLYDNNTYMIFSDKQAYPFYCVRLKIIKSNGE